MDNAPYFDSVLPFDDSSFSSYNEEYVQLSEAINRILMFHHFKRDRHHIRVYVNPDYSRELLLFHTASNSCSRITFNGQVALSVFEDFLYGSFNNLLLLDPDLCGDGEPLHKFD